MANPNPNDPAPPVTQNPGDKYDRLDFNFRRYAHALRGSRAAEHAAMEEVGVAIQSGNRQEAREFVELLRQARDRSDQLVSVLNSITAMQRDIRRAEAAPHAPPEGSGSRDSGDSAPPAAPPE